ncbi:hypothetical protein CEF21_13615 [Bacillus sp. FJAT-42376]|uniref:YpjP family protein n=1 Tax=Bacillus sp. FJAT-42376 TaxID=2014076 RepID=UPI000F4F55B5|nr:YpjP family protein [Bacillus sp. FJAT-42376]AZB43257.1 hypothetical protein CEF21_13615 [Bacillus sp. FJAT-42376]
MNKWLKKTLVALFSIVTLGMVAPPAVLLAEENSREVPEAVYPKQLDPQNTEIYEPDLLQFKQLAKEQTHQKFGSRIGPVIEKEFDAVILPEIEKVMEQELTKKESMNLVISEKPGSGRSEKIFHIYDRISGQDVIRFHVRVDHPPGDGYWFNFHYHMYRDSFEQHHELGRIYWDRNTPPAWMTH